MQATFSVPSLQPSEATHNHKRESTCPAVLERTLLKYFGETSSEYSTWLKLTNMEDLNLRFQKIILLKILKENIDMNMIPCYGHLQ